MTTTPVAGLDDATVEPADQPCETWSWERGLPSFLIHGRGLGVRCC